MKKIFSLILAILLLASLSTCAFADFDPSVLSSMKNYEYDKFDNQWSYYEAYMETYSDAYVVVGMKVYSEEEGDNPGYIEMYVKVMDKSGNPLRKVTGVMFLIDGTKYSYESMLEGEGSSSVVIGKLEQPLVEALSEGSGVTVRIKTDRGNTDIDMDQNQFNTSLKKFCKKILKTGILDYLDYEETGSIYSFIETMFPLTINGKNVQKPVEQ